MPQIRGIRRAEASLVVIPRSSAYSGSYTVSWTSVAVATSYQLEERANGGGWTQLHNAPGTSRAISGNAAGTYEYRARACNVAGCAGYSAAVATQVIPPPAGVPTLTVPASSTTGGYVVNWTAVATATAYQLDERVNGGGWTLIHHAAATSKTVLGKPAGTYEYRVRACNDAGCGGDSAVKAIVLSTPPMPMNLNAAQMSHSCETAWAESAGTTSYQLQNAGGTIYQGPNTWFSQTSPRTCLAPYMVRACNGMGCSAWSAPAFPPGVIIHSGPGPGPAMPTVETEGGAE